jgi:hypothetical protein
VHGASSERRKARIDSEGKANLRAGTSLPPVLGVGPMEAELPTDAALHCGTWRVISRFEIKILILEIRNCDQGSDPGGGR